MASSPRRRSKSSGNTKTQLQEEKSNAEEILNADIKSKNSEQTLKHYEPDDSEKQKEKLNFLNKIQTLRYALETDLLACDAKWTLFVAAALSYRYDSVLKPIPLLYAEDGNDFNINHLVTTINDTPKLRVVLQNLIEPTFNEISKEVIELLYWLIIVLREPALRLIESEELNAVLLTIDEQAMKTKPTHVFEVNSLTGFHSEVAFRERIGNLPVKMAFMGNKLDTYFSILQNGFTDLPETKEYIELSTDLASSLKNSPDCAAWGASLCGSIISCTALCEFALDTDCDKMVTNQNDKSRVNIHLKNPQNIRLRYLLFYGKRFPKRMPSNKRLLSWLYRHKYSLSLLSYLLFLISIGIANSGSGERFKLYVYEKIDFILEFCRRIITREPISQ